MKNYNIVFYDENEKYKFIAAARAAGAVITGISGYYDGYYIQFNADPDTIEILEKAGY